MGDVFPRVRLAAAQIASVYMDREATIEKTCRFIEEAADHGAKIIGFPEFHISGPPFWYFTKLTNPFLEEEGKRFRTIVREAIEVPSPATDRLCQAARAAHMYVVSGINERDRHSLGTLYNAQLFIDPAGNILGVHRKLQPTIIEKLIYGRGDGSNLHVFPTEYGELGGLLCGEHANSLAKFCLIARGEKIHVAGWPAFPCNLFPALQRESVLFRVRQHAHEGKLFLISSTGYMDQATIDALCDTPEEKARIIDGGGCTAIIGPNGEFRAGPKEDGEGILYADADFEDAVEAKWTHDILGNYGRYDVLSLNYNPERLMPLHYTTSAVASRGSEQLNDLEELRSRIQTLEQQLEAKHQELQATW